MYNLEYLTNNIIQGDSYEVLKQFPEKSIHSVITSPPYYKQRDYQADGQLGQEKTVKEYVDNLCNIFDEVKKVLRDDGVIYINIGDKYINGNLANVPFKFAIEMQERGWIQKNCIIWKKRGGLPESVKKRFTNITEYILMFVKTSNYFFEQIFEPYKVDTLKRFQYGNNVKPESPYSHFQCENMGERLGYNNRGRNKTNVWELATSNFKGAHFAVMPLKLIQICLETTPEKTCKICGKGLKKLYKKGKDLNDVKKSAGSDLDGFYKGISKKDYKSNDVQNASDVKRRVLESMKEYIFTGYETCECQKTNLINEEGLYNRYIYERIPRGGEEKKSTKKDINSGSLGMREFYKANFRKYIIDSKTHIEFANDLKKEIEDNNLKDKFNQKFGKTKWEHWVRVDKSGRALPSNDNFREIIKYTNESFNKKWTKLILTEIEDIVSDKKVKTKISNDFNYSNLVDKEKEYGKALILDPFMGAGSVAMSCIQLDRNYIGIELNPDYIKTAEERLKPYKQQYKFLF